LHGSSEKVSISRFVLNERAENELAVFSLSDAEICNASRSYEKRKASKKKKCKDLAVLAETNRFF